VQAEAAGAGRPVRAGAMTAKPRHLLPRLPTVGRLEERGILDAGVDGVRIRQRRLEVPDPLELPRMRRTVVPLVGTGNTVVDELVADGFPCLAAVVRALDELTKPAGGLRDVDAVRVRRRSLEVIDLPAAKMRTADIPFLTCAVGCQDERALARADEYSNSAHRRSFLRGAKSHDRSDPTNSTVGGDACQRNPVNNSSTTFSDTRAARRVPRASAGDRN
jgi:hypothetical protein